MNGLKQLPVAAFAVDGMGKICGWNDAAEAVCGKREADMLGKRAWLVFSPKRCATVVDDAFESGQLESVAVEICGKSVMAHAKPTLDEAGEVTGATVVLLPNSQGSSDRSALGKIAALDRVQAVIEFEMDGTIVTANENFLAVMGYSLDEIKGRHHSMFAEPDYASSRQYKDFWARLNGGQPDSGEYLRYGKGGKEVWIQASYNPLLDEQGKPVRVVKFATDITTQVRDRLDAKGNLSAINRVQAAIEFKLDGTIVAANELFLQTMGYELSEIVGKHHSMFADPAFAKSQEYADFWRRLNTGKPDSGEYLRFGKGGKEVWIQASYNPILDGRGRPTKVVKYATDITAQVRVRREAQRLQAIVENSPKPCMLLDLKDFTITYANPAAINTLATLEQYLPCRASELVGKSVDIFHKNPSHQRRMLADERNLPHNARIKLGPETLLLQVYALRDAEGKYVGPALAWEVVTDRARLEEADAKAKDVIKRANWRWSNWPAAMSTRSSKRNWTVTWRQ